MGLILGIETSCDECSASVVQYEKIENLTTSLEVLSLTTHSQVKVHEPYGGVVPEIASRNHLETINPIIEEALKQAQVSYSQLEAIAVTNRPGLIGALLVGVSAAKAIAYCIQKPLIPIHHIEGHIASLFINNSPDLKSLQYPLLVAVISGGHTQLHLIPAFPTQWAKDFLGQSLIGQSKDDAAGEAFDKIAKLVGFPYPGGKWIDQYSHGGNPKEFSLPRALIQKNVLDFSFSGLKTAAALLVEELTKKNMLKEQIHNLCASVQEAIVDNIWSKVRIALEKFQCRSLGIVGGVASNSRLRSKIVSECNIPFFFPDLKYCTDNAAMIAVAGAFRYQQGYFLSQEQFTTLNAVANSES